MHHLFTHSAVCPRVPVSQTGLPVPLRAFRARGPWFCGLCLRFRWFYFCCWRTVPVGGLSKACVVLAASRGTNWRELDASTRGRWVAIPEFSREKRGTSHAVCSKGRCLSCTRSCEGSLLTLESWPLGIGEPLTLGHFLSSRFVCFVPRLNFFGGSAQKILEARAPADSVLLLLARLLVQGLLPVWLAVRRLGGRCHGWGCEETRLFSGL